MKQIIFRFLALLIYPFAAAMISSPLAYADQCAGKVFDISIKKVTANAAFFTNLRNKPGSIKFESNAIFNAAKEQAAEIKIPKNPCPAGCTAENRGVMIFRSTPQKVLSDYSDAEHCSSLEKETSQNPLRYENAEIHSVEDLNDWIGDLSQGDSKHGEDLYEKCDASCSPRYEYTISRNEVKPGSYTAKASIICGPARDKDDNQYTLESFFRFQCTKS